MKNNNISNKEYSGENKSGEDKKIRCKSLIIDGTKYRTLLNKKFENRKNWRANKNKEITAYIPGVIKEINVKKGQKVQKGDTLLILEAMKMYNQLKSHEKGIIKDIKVDIGQCVIKNQLLIEIE